MKPYIFRICYVISVIIHSLQTHHAFALQFSNFLDTAMIVYWS